MFCTLYLRLRPIYIVVMVVVRLSSSAFELNLVHPRCLDALQPAMVWLLWF